MVDMTYHRFGRTELRLSRVGLGAGGPSRLGTVHGADEVAVERLIGCARDLGINHIDTARGYGTESGIGRALQRLEAKEMMIATKVHCFDGPRAETAAEPMDAVRLVAEIETSLSQLRRDHIEIFQFHAVLPKDLDQVIDQLLPAARKLQQQGKIGHIGITEDPSVDYGQQMACAAVNSGHFDTLMVQYSILDQIADGPTFASTQRQDVGVFCMSAARAAFTDRESLRVALERMGETETATFEALLDDKTSIADLAFQFAAAQPAIDVVLVGTGKPEHLQASTAAILGPPLSGEHRAWLVERYGSSDGQILWIDY